MALLMLSTQVLRIKLKRFATLACLFRFLGTLIAALALYLCRGQWLLALSESIVVPG